MVEGTLTEFVEACHVESAFEDVAVDDNLLQEIAQAVTEYLEKNELVLMISHFACLTYLLPQQKKLSW